MPDSEELRRTRPEVLRRFDLEIQTANCTGGPQADCSIG